MNNEIESRVYVQVTRVTRVTTMGTKHRNRSLLQGRRGAIVLCGTVVVAPRCPAEHGQGGGPGLAEDQVPGHGEVWLDARIIAQLNVVLGDSLKIGAASFKVRDRKSVV